MHTLATPDGQVTTLGYNGALLTSEAQSGGVTGTVRFTHDAHLRVSTETAAGHSITYGYSTDGQVTSAGTLSITRSSTNGSVTSTTLGSISTSQSISAFGELVRTAASDPGGELFAEEVLTRDNLGRITSKRETILGAEHLFEYAYDARGRLSDVWENSVQVGHYEYDPNGNRVSATLRGVTQTGTYDEQDRVISYGDTSYVHDEAGDLLTKTDAGGTTSYDIDAFRAL